MTNSLTADELHYLAATDSKDEFNLRQVRALAEEVLEYRTVCARMLEWAQELERAGGVGRFIGLEVRKRLQP